MTDTQATETRPADLVDAAAGTAAGTDWTAELRASAASSVSQMALPDRTQEGWRYTPVRFLQETRFVPSTSDAFEALQLSDIDELLLPEGETTRLVFVNGYLASSLSSELNLQNGLVVNNLGGRYGQVEDSLRQCLGALAERRHVFAALNSALMSDGAVIHVPSDRTIEKPIEVLHISVGMDEPQICHPRHLIVVEAGGQVDVIERYAALGEGRYFNNAMIEVSVGRGARLGHCRIQQESAVAQHLSDLHVRLDAGARYKLANIGLGGSWSRTELRLVFAGEGGEAELDGLMLARDKQLNDVHLDIQHNVPGCTSRETFRGVLDGKGKVVFDGRILVAKDAQQTDAALSNDNLMLSRSSEVDTKPQLEIYADDVKCSHGTTVGELDHDMLFYLRSRGIPAAQARQMLCEGFASQIIDQIEHPRLRHQVLQQLAQRLGEAA